MALKFNNTAIADTNTIKYNGNNVTKVVYNGTTVWEKSLAQPYKIVGKDLQNCGWADVYAGGTKSFSDTGFKLSCSSWYYEVGGYVQWGKQHCTAVFDVKKCTTLKITIRSASVSLSGCVIQSSAYLEDPSDSNHSTRWEEKKLSETESYPKEIIYDVSGLDKVSITNMAYVYGVVATATIELYSIEFS